MMPQPKTQFRTAKQSVIRGNQLAQIDFLRVTEELLQDTLRSDRALINEMKQELTVIDPGRLYIHRCSSGFHFGRYDKQTNTETGITGNMDQVHALARRSFLESRIATVENHTRRLNRILHSVCDAKDQLSLARRLNRFSEAGLNLCRIIFTPEQNEWINQAYSPNPHYPENLKYPTRGNLLMRSKSEAFLGSSLELAGLPFRYDDLVVIHYESLGDRPSRDSYFADFKIPNLIGGITIHEHLGAFQLEKYSVNALQRLNDYNNFSLEELPGRTVTTSEITWSFEKDLQDPQRHRQLLKRILLPLD